MSLATCGVTLNPGCRCAHPGYACSKSEIAKMSITMPAAIKSRFRSFRLVILPRPKIDDAKKIELDYVESYYK